MMLVSRIRKTHRISRAITMILVRSASITGFPLRRMSYVFSTVS
jgi:hypothetical protein